MILFNILYSNIIIIFNQVNLVLCSFSLIIVITFCIHIHIHNDDDDLCDAASEKEREENCPNTTLTTTLTTYNPITILLLLYSIFPLVASLLSWIYFIIQRQRKLSTLFDMDEHPLRCKSNYQLPPFLPEKSEDSLETTTTTTTTWNKLRDELSAAQQNEKKKKKSKTKNRKEDISIQVPSSGWAIVTGASRGIGRALAIELARYNIPIILVARDKVKLNELSMLIEECYGVATKIIISDLSKSNAVEELVDQVSKISVVGNDDDDDDANDNNNNETTTLEIDILIHNAGIGDNSPLVEMDSTKLEDMISLNTTAGSKLCQHFGSKMKDRRRGRIVLISSITGGVPGVPNSAVYAATKSFQRSFASSIGMELEAYGVGVTCIMPGAVHDTNFASQSNMNHSLIWYFPVGRITAPIVASCTIHGMITGCPEIVVGWLNVLSVKFIFLLLPTRIVNLICRIAWEKPPWVK